MSDAFFSTEYQTFWAACQSVILLGGFAFIFYQIRLSRKHLHLETINALRQTWNGAEMMRVRVAVCDDLLNHRLGAEAAKNELLGFFEEMAQLTASGRLDKEFIWSTYSYFVEGYWIGLRPHVYAYREKLNDHTYFLQFQTMVMDLSEECARNETHTLNAELARDFLFEELELAQVMHELSPVVPANRNAVA